MGTRQFEASKLDISTLSGVTDLSIHTIRKGDLRKLKGLDGLPLTHLSLRWLSAEDLTAVPLPAGLIDLRLWHSPKLKSLTGLERCSRLRTLELRENGKPLDLSALAALEALEALTIDGGYGDGQSLVSLAPIEGLPIRELTFINVKGDALDLGPIARLPMLEKLSLSERLMPPEELAKVAAAKPWYHDQLRRLPEANPAYAKPCKRCGQLPHEMFLKGKAFHWCLACQKAKVDAHLEAFDRLVANASG